MPSQAFQQYCLFPESDAALAVVLDSTEDGAGYVGLSKCERLAINNGQLSRCESGAEAIQLETLRHTSGSSLLMAVGPKLPVTVNGLLASRVSVLEAGDLVQINEHTLHVALLNHPYVGPPQESLFGTACGYCRLPIRQEPDMRVYVCPMCQQPTHYQDEAVPVENRLECAVLSSRCGHCDGEIMFSECFSNVPDL